MVKRKKSHTSPNLDTGEATQCPPYNENQQQLSMRGAKLLSEQCTPNTTILETLHAKGVYAAKDFFSMQECQAWIDMFDANARVEHVSHPASRSMAHRECRRWQLHDWDLSDQIFQRIQKTILRGLDFKLSEYPIACNGNLRLYRYDKGMRFGRHIDESNETDRGTTRVTVLIYLSECQGGATRFHLTRKHSFAFQPKAGAILLHAHGDQCLEHEGDPVLAGSKYVLRTDLVYATKR